ncbi:MAG: STAS domain-containing protein [Candidatus Eremiobacteraeota bacterium]|nr:STAS domain-containing protein [Candidatus Eremiobacteraeota bacterium]
MPRTTQLPTIFTEQSAELLDQWLRAQAAAGGASDSIGRTQSSEFLSLLRDAVQAAGIENTRGPAYAPLHAFLAQLVRARMLKGETPSQVATFVFSLKEALFGLLRARYADDAATLADETWSATRLLDSLGLYTTEIYQRAREEVIARQQQDMLELSTPVVKLWDGILALPMIGTLDSARTQVVMETLLQRIVETGAEVAVIDITGVPTVDTLTAQHLLKTVTAARLMGADCIISGIRPQIAQTIVHLGVDLAGVTTKATLADAFRAALARTGQKVVRS